MSTLFKLRTTGRIENAGDIPDLPAGLTLLHAVTHGDRTTLLGYDRATHKVSTWSLSRRAPYLKAVDNEISLAEDADGVKVEGWDQLSSFNYGGVTYLLTYAAKEGTFAIFRLDSGLRASAPYSLRLTRNTPTQGYTVVAPFTSLGNQYVLAYSFDTGLVSAFSVTAVADAVGDTPPLLMLNVWYHYWAKNWTRFALFKLGGANFFWKTNTGKLNVNIDHIQDDPSKGTVEVGSYLQSCMPDALDITMVTAATTAHGQPWLVAYRGDTGEARAIHFWADCNGFETADSLVTEKGASGLTSWRLGDASFVLLYGGSS